jgi:TDG/mug DNA glycosylase family protein
MLDLARRRHGDVALVHADLAHLPFTAGRLGGAWARASYLHVPRTSLPAALAQLHRALAVGAPLEMTMRSGTGEGPIPGDDFPGRFFAGWEAGDLERVVIGAGFELEANGVVASGEWITVRARRARTLPDFVGPDLDVLVCGLNPSVISADAGFGYARSNNRFWRAAVASGLVAASRARRPLEVLAHDRVGMTDLVKRATPRADQLSRAEYQAGWDRLSWLTSWLHPRVVLFVGLAGWRAAVDRRAGPGWRPPSDDRGGVAAYVMPSTSGLNAATSLDALVAHMAAAAAVARGYSSEARGGSL